MVQVNASQPPDETDNLIKLFIWGAEHNHFEGIDVIDINPKNKNLTIENYHAKNLNWFWVLCGLKLYRQQGAKI